MSSPAFRPGIAQGLYPERRSAPPSDLDRYLTSTLGVLSRQRELTRIGKAVYEIGARQGSLTSLSDSDLREKATLLRGQLALHGISDDLTLSCFALIREQARRTLGTPHYAVQLMGGLAMARGRLA